MSYVQSAIVPAPEAVHTREVPNQPEHMRRLFQAFRQQAAGSGGRVSPTTKETVLPEKGPDRRAILSPTRAQEEQERVGGAVSSEASRRRSTFGYDATSLEAEIEKINRNVYIPASKKQRMIAELRGTDTADSDGDSGAALTERTFRQYFPKEGGKPYFSTETPETRRDLCAWLDALFAKAPEYWDAVLRWIVRYFLMPEWIEWMARRRPAGNKTHIHGLILHTAANAPLYMYLVEKERVAVFGDVLPPTIFEYGMSVTQTPPPDLTADDVESIIASFLFAASKYESTPWPISSWFRLALLRANAALTEVVIRTFQAHTYPTLGEEHRVRLLSCTNSIGQTLLAKAAEVGNVPLTTILVDENCNIFAGKNVDLLAPVVWARRFREYDELARKERALMGAPSAVKDRSSNIVRRNETLNTLALILESHRNVISSVHKGLLEDPVVSAVLSKLREFLGDQLYGNMIRYIEQDPEEVERMQREEQERQEQQQSGERRSNSAPAMPSEELAAYMALLGLSKHDDTAEDDEDGEWLGTRAGTSEMELPSEEQGLWSQDGLSGVTEQEHGQEYEQEYEYDEYEGADGDDGIQRGEEAKEHELEFGEKRVVAPRDGSQFS